MTDQHPRDDEIAGRLRAHESRVPVTAEPTLTPPRSVKLLVPITAAAAAVLIAAVLILPSALRPTAVDPSPATSPTPISTATPTPSATPSAQPTPTERPSPTPMPTGPFAVEWSSADIPGSAVAIESILTLEDRVIAAGRDGDEAAAWISFDAGATWQRATVDTTRATDIAATFYEVLASEDALIGVGSWGAIGSDQFAWMTWRSDDGGLTWSEHPDDSRYYALRTATVLDGAIVGIGWTYAGTLPFDAFVSRSEDGLTWQSINPEVFEYSQVHAVTTVGDRLVAVGIRHSPAETGEYFAAAWLSDDGGASWRMIPLAPFGSAPLGYAADVVAKDDGSLVAVGASHGGRSTSIPTSWISIDDGETWRTENMGTDGAATAVAAADRGLVAIGSTNLFNPGEVSVYTSADGILWRSAESITEADAWVLTADAVDSRVAVATSCDSGDTCPAPLVFGTVRELER